MRKTILPSLALFAILTAACTGSGATPSPTDAPPASTAPSAATPAASDAPTEAPSATPDACAVENLTLVTPGKFTIGTDNPAYPPYFAPNADGTTTAPWEIGDPNSGDGFESAVGFAIAEQMGFARADVVWEVVPFANSFAPGPKPFDIDLNQITFKTERTQAVDLSTGYYFGNQALVVLKSSPLAKVTSIAALKDYVFGAQVGTTSYDAILSLIAPTKDVRVYDTNDLAVKALKQKSIDGIVVDLPTADFITNVQVGNSTIVGQFDGGTPEYFSASLTKGSPLTPCVNAAIEAMTIDGTLDVLASAWLPFQDAVPVFEP